MRYLAPLLLLLSFSCSSTEEPPKPVPPIYESVSYQIDIDRDTVLVTESGTIIKIPAGSIVSPNSPVELEVADFLNKSDMILAGLSTVTDEGNYLVSGGMISITSTDSDASINADNPIQVSIPVNGKFVDEMRIFEADESGDEIVWKEGTSKTLLEEKIAKGQRIFEASCNRCHQICGISTGPPLANVFSCRDSAYLIQMTRNSVELIRSGHPLANALWITWAGSVMPANPNLSDEDIFSIYDYIESVSDCMPVSEAQLNTEQAALRLPCEITESYVEEVLQQYLSTSVSVTDPRTGDSFPDTLGRYTWDAEIVPVKSKPKVVYYDFSFRSFTTINVDYYLSKLGTFIERPTVQLRNYADGSLSFYMVSKEDNMIIPLDKKGPIYLLRRSEGKDQIEFPNDYPVAIIAINFTVKGKVLFAREDVVLKEQGNQFRLSLEPSSLDEIQRNLDSLN